MKLWYIFFLALEWRRTHRDLNARRPMRWDEFRRLLDCYSEKHRFYHVLRHLYLTIKMARQCYKGVDSRSISWVVMALFYHDIVYVIGSKTNEDDSAAQWRRYADNRFDEPIVDKIDHMIMLTKSHLLGEDACILDQIMNDCDMSILATECEDEYIRYAQNIWREYRVVGREAYLAGRLAFLKGLTVHEMFHTDVCSIYFAECNVDIEIETLEDHPERIMVD